MAAADDEPDEAPEPGLLQRLEGRPGLTALVALATFAALVIGVLAAVPDWRDMLSEQAPPAPAIPAAGVTASGPPPAEAPPAETGPRAIDLVVRDPDRIDDPKTGQITWTMPAVELTVLNRAAQRSVVTRVVVTIEESLAVRQCDSEGEPLEMSATYDVELPLRPPAGTVLEVPVSQQQDADEADRFALRFTTPPRESPSIVHLYRLAFALKADGDPAGRPAGTGVVAVPAAPSSAGAYFWGEAYASGQYVLPPRPGVDDTVACMKANSATLRDFLAVEAELSPEMAEAKADIRT